MRKIMRIFGIIKNRLPKTCVVPVKVYQTTRSLIRAEARECGMTYIQLIQHYGKVYKQENYIRHEFWTPVTHHRNPVLNISGLAGEPVKLSYENLKDKPDYEIAFLILHEQGHIVNGKSGKLYDEKAADRFAIRWVEKLIDEGLINHPSKGKRR